LDKGSFVDVFVGPGVFSFALHFAFEELALVEVAVFEEVFANAVLF
jgi:hypothetical protein